MKLFDIGFTRVSIHPGLFLVLFLACVVGRLGELLQAFLVLVMHETFHAMAANALHYRIESVELLPFGGVARMEDSAASPRAEWIIAFAGPFCTFIAAGGIATALSVWPEVKSSLMYLMNMHVALGVFNLLPAFPLDGGRMLRAVLLRCGVRLRAATLFTSWLGVGCGSLVLGASVYLAVRGIWNPFLFVMGVFLIIGAIKEQRVLPQARLSAIVRRAGAFAKGEAMPVQYIAVREDTSLGAALAQLSSSRYTVLLVLDKELRPLGQLDEGRLLKGMAKHGRNAPVRALL